MIVGWDGADWDILDDLIERGDLPSVREMADVLTGMHPGGHAVFDFMERHPTSFGRRDPT